MTDHTIAEDGADPRPAPTPTATSAHYWERAAAGEFVLQHCAHCDHYQFPPRGVCRACWRADGLEWRPASGRGTVATHSVVHRPPVPEFAPFTPYVVALIDLEEGPRMMSNVVGEGAVDVAIGTPVTVDFQPRADGAAVVVFRAS